MTEDSLVHKEAVLAIIPGLQKSRKPFHPRAPLSVQLRRGQAYLYSQYALLYTHFSIQLT